MLGGMLAGHNEGETQLKDGKRYFYGMSPHQLSDTHGARKDGYRGTEGKTVILDDKGPNKDTVEQLLGGIRSTCTYIGARRVKDMSNVFIMCVNNVINRVFDKYENDQILKWIATFTLIVGTFALTQDSFIPIGPNAFSIRWNNLVSRSVIWKESALITTNAVLTITRIGGIMLYYLR